MGNCLIRFCNMGNRLPHDHNKNNNNNNNEEGYEYSSDSDNNGVLTSPINGENIVGGTDTETRKIKRNSITEETDINIHGALIPLTNGENTVVETDTETREIKRNSTTEETEDNIYGALISVTDGENAIGETSATNGENTETDTETKEIKSNSVTEETDDNSYGTSTSATDGENTVGKTYHHYGTSISVTDGENAIGETSATNGENTETNTENREMKSNSITEETDDNSYGTSISATDGENRVGEEIVLEEDEEEECPICLNGYEVENPRTNTPCDHCFHFQCIIEWSQWSHLCPVCATGIVFNEEGQLVKLDGLHQHMEEHKQEAARLRTHSRLRVGWRVDVHENGNGQTYCTIHITNLFFSFRLWRQTKIYRVLWPFFRPFDNQPKVLLRVHIMCTISRDSDPQRG
ncbi:uncharacterized protein LOC131066760 [Cryptomeria japonica]|uniref:uncharacterized protein LOC131066760 n=1 Tax=Cryptomeria japonica TaxID=3369 RepID=UPI0027DA2029|nr:uncharacterized protein LOC131066760 [Cryptomeria japonica]